MMWASITSIASVAVVIFGWIVINAQENARETRKEGRILTDAAKKEASKVAKSAVSYFCDGRHELSYAIKAAIDAIEIELGRTPNFRVDGPIMKAFVEFGEALTAEPFDSAASPTLPMNSQQVIDILRTRNALVTLLERTFRTYYLKEHHSFHRSRAGGTR